MSGAACAVCLFRLLSAQQSAGFSSFMRPSTLLCSRSSSLSGSSRRRRKLSDMTTKGTSRESTSQRPSDAPVGQAFTIMSAQRIQSNLGALFAGISLNQWMALTPPELVQAHLNLDQQTLAALRKDKPVIVAPLQQYPKRKPLPEWPDKTIAVLSTENEEVHAIPITAPLRAGDHRILLRLKRCRESLARLREHPEVALTIFARGNVAFTARGPARVVQEPMLGSPMFAAVAIDVEHIDDHRQRDLVVDSGVSLDWTNERTQRFVKEHLNALREVAASGE